MKDIIIIADVHHMSLAEINTIAAELCKEHHNVVVVESAKYVLKPLPKLDLPLEAVTRPHHIALKRAQTRNKQHFRNLSNRHNKL